MTSAQCFGFRGKFGYRVSSDARTINFVNDFCLFLSVAFVMIRYFLAVVTVLQT